MQIFSGMNVRLRYFVRVTITRSYNTVVKEQDFAVQNFTTVRICLHIFTRTHQHPRYFGFLLISNFSCHFWGVL